MLPTAGYLETMETSSSQSFFKILLHLLAAIMILVLSGASAVSLAAVIGSFFNIEC